MIEKAIDGVHVVKLLQKLNIATFYVLFDGCNFEWLSNIYILLIKCNKSESLKMEVNRSNIYIANCKCHLRITFGYW
jgi:hypothetical protein